MTGPDANINSPANGATLSDIAKPSETDPSSEATNKNEASQASISENTPENTLEKKVDNDFDALDFGYEKADTHILSPEIGQDYDPRPQEDQARRNIAYLLIGLLWLAVACIFVLIALGTVNVTEIKEFASLLGPIVTLVSAATGFYYGTKSK